MVGNGKTKEAAQKDIENHIKQNNGNSNTACTLFKFADFASIMIQDIQRSLQLQ